MLCDCKIDSIHNYVEESEKHKSYYDFGDIEDSWFISQEEHYISGYCNMDNFDMHTFLHDYLKIPGNVVKWDY